MKKQKSLNKTLLAFGSFLVIITIGFFISQEFLPSAAALTDKELLAEYSVISGGTVTGSCGALNQEIDEETMFKGACCGKMRPERYIKQRRFLEKYDDYDIIPKDPWNVPAEHAERLTKFDKDIVLTAAEQEVYDEALEIFDEGPCCCKCWRWFAFNGMAKHLIQLEGFNAQQIAELWAAEDVCGDEDPFEELGEHDEE